MKNEEKMLLIVDDEPDLCWAIENILRKDGLQSQKALSGQEALKLIEQTHFSVVFLDAKLPDMDGLDLAERIRAIDPRILIVMISGYFYKDDVSVREAIARGLICGFVSKPFMHDEILKIVHSALGA